VLTSLCGQDDVVFSDALNHASIIDGCRLSRAKVAVYRHGDATHLDELLCASGDARRRVIVSETVFSMDGDCAPVVALAALAKRYDAILVLDEAHALGVLGCGRGACAQHGVKPDVLVGTLGKALGSSGGFAACSVQVRDLLINRARTFIFTTALAPACAGAALAAAKIVEAQPELAHAICARTRIFVEQLRQLGVSVPDVPAAIVPIVLGENAGAVRAAESLREQGLWCTAVRPPTVPEGTARLRLSVTLAHSEADLMRAAETIARVVREI
jgi:glycine C-acetyltransferase/8-amino-7-oxononanoate synthase